MPLLIYKPVLRKITHLTPTWPHVHESLKRTTRICFHQHTFDLWGRTIFAPHLIPLPTLSLFSSSVCMWVQRKPEKKKTNSPVFLLPRLITLKLVEIPVLFFWSVVLYFDEKRTKMMTCRICSFRFFFFVLKKKRK